jgi:hypothetical protein
VTDNESRPAPGALQVCPECGRPNGEHNPGCSATWRIGQDARELRVEGTNSDEVAEVARLLLSGTWPKAAGDADSPSGFWTRSRKAGAFVVGVATVVAAIAAVLALIGH